MKRLPKLCIHPGSQQYYIRIHRQPVYLGRVGGPAEEAAAEAERLRVLAEYQAAGVVRRTTRPTVNELLASYLVHVQTHYRKPDGTPTSEQMCIAQAVRPLRRLYGRTLVSDFGPRALAALQRTMIDGSWMTEADRQLAGERLRGGWCRRLINANINRIRRIFRWGVSQELVAPEVLTALESVAPLLKGRTTARETAKVPPAPQESIDAVLEYGDRRIADLVRLQLLTAGRPGEIIRIRGQDLDRTGEVLAQLLGEQLELGSVWAYLPGLDQAGGDLRQDHKTAHHGYGKVIPVGPQAQAILARYLDRPQGDFLFSPAEARAERHASLRARRKTPVQPSQQDRRREKPRREPGPRWTTSSYAHAIASTIDRANRSRAEKGLLPVPHFHPHQLRHNAATALQRQFGVDVARIVCGHQSVHTTEIYVAKDLAAAFKAMAQAG